MELTITGHHVDVTPAIRQYTEEKLLPLQRHFDKITGIHVVFNIEKLEQVAEATIHVPGADYHASDKKADLYAAIDGMCSKLDRQLLKHKEKMKNHAGMDQHKRVNDQLDDGLL